MAHIHAYTQGHTDTIDTDMDGHKPGTGSSHTYIQKTSRQRVPFIVAY